MQIDSTPVQKIGGRSGHQLAQMRCWGPRRQQRATIRRNKRRNRQPNAMQASEVVEDAHEESQDPRLAWLVNLATEMGYSLQKTSIYNSELSQAITSKLINRLGGSVYQAAAFSLPTFPRSCAEKLLPPSLITEQTANVVTWKATTIAELRSLLATLFTHDDPNAFPSKTRMDAIKRGGPRPLKESSSAPSVLPVLPAGTPPPASYALPVSSPQLRRQTTSTSAPSWCTPGTAVHAAVL